MHTMFIALERLITKPQVGLFKFVTLFGLKHLSKTFGKSITTVRFFYRNFKTNKIFVLWMYSLHTNFITVNLFIHILKFIAILYLNEYKQLKYYDY